MGILLAKCCWTLSTSASRWRKDINGSTYGLQWVFWQNEGHRHTRLAWTRWSAGSSTEKNGGRLRPTSHGIMRWSKQNTRTSSGSQVFCQSVAIRMVATFVVVRAGRYYEAGMHSHTPLMVAWHRSEPVCSIHKHLQGKEPTSRSSQSNAVQSMRPVHETWIQKYMCCMLSLFFSFFILHQQFSEWANQCNSLNSFTGCHEAHLQKHAKIAVWKHTEMHCNAASCLSSSRLLQFTLSWKYWVECFIYHCHLLSLVTTLLKTTHKD